MPNPFESQLESAIAAYDTAIAASRHNDGSDMSPAQHHQLLTSSMAAIQRAAVVDSIYFQQANENHGGNEFIHLANVIGICTALLADIRNGFLKTLEEIIHSDVFSDYLEMAEHLVNSGYKDAAAVIAGSTLEAHLRNLCAKFGVAIDNGGKPKKADTINADLMKAGAYGKIDLKNVTAWLGLRNDAAHGNYAGYDDKQVSLLISSIRDFIARLPA